jgi:hypothetical protein
MATEDELVNKLIWRAQITWFFLFDLRASKQKCTGNGPIDVRYHHPPRLHISASSHTIWIH